MAVSFKLPSLNSLFGMGCKGRTIIIYFELFLWERLVSLELQLPRIPTGFEWCRPPPAVSSPPPGGGGGYIARFGSTFAGFGYFRFKSSVV